MSTAHAIPVLAAALVCAAVVAGCNVGSAPTFPPRPEAATPCERAYAAAAYAWEDETVDPTPAPGGPGFILDGARLAILDACTLAELKAAGEKFLVHAYRDAGGDLITYWTPSTTSLRFDVCNANVTRRTRLCREVLGE